MGQEEFVLPLPIFPILPFLLSSHLLNTIGTPLAPSLYSRLPCSSRLPALACRVSSCLVGSVVLFLLLASSPIARFLLPSLPQPVAPTWRSPPPPSPLFSHFLFLFSALFFVGKRPPGRWVLCVYRGLYGALYCVACFFSFLPFLSSVRRPPFRTTSVLKAPWLPAHAHQRPRRRPMLGALGPHVVALSLLIPPRPPTPPPSAHQQTGGEANKLKKQNERARPHASAISRMGTSRAVAQSPTVEDDGGVNPSAASAPSVPSLGHRRTASAAAVCREPDVDVLPACDPSRRRQRDGKVPTVPHCTFRERHASHVSDIPPTSISPQVVHIPTPARESIVKLLTHPPHPARPLGLQLTRARQAPGRYSPSRPRQTAS